MSRAPVESETAERASTETLASASTTIREVVPIDLHSALQLAGVQNPEITQAYARVLQATAVHQLAAAQALPNINAGTNYDSHTGALQQASGNILSVNRSALYVGAGGNAVAAGSVGIPGVQYNLNISQSIFNYLVTCQIEEQSRFASQAVENNVQLRVALAYGELLKAEGIRAIAIQARDDSAEVARGTAAFSRTGQGRQSDADRAATELARRDESVVEADAAVGAASARLIQLLNLESSMRLHATDNWVVPRPIVPDIIPLEELVAMSLYQRPELADRRAAIHAAMLSLKAAKVLPFSPQFLAGFSAGGFGGGSDLVAGDSTPRFGADVNQPRFGKFNSRTDVDVIAYWSLMNLGVGNKALIDAARARVCIADFDRLTVLNQVRAEVADAFARVQTRLAQMETRQKAVTSSNEAFREDLIRTKQNEGHPIEVLDSLRLSFRTRTDYLNAIVDYNQAHFALYTAIGQPPADLLIRPAGVEVPAPEE